MQTDPHAIYMRFDDGFLPFARACLNSLRCNYPAHPHLIVDYRGEDEGMHRFLGAMSAEILPPDAPPEFMRHVKLARVGDVIADRFRLFRSGFNRFETILHLDADMLVLKPLHDLFDRPAPFFVANHEPSPSVRVFTPAALPRLRAQLEADGLPVPAGQDDMVNAGLFTLPRAVRTPQTLAKLANLAARYGRWFAYADQSLLSLWLLSRGERPTLDFADNFQTPFFTDADVNVSFDDIRVLHFTSARKPGTRAFDRWDRVGPRRERLIETFEHYRDLPL